jgi:hypothetical protein
MNMVTCPNCGMVVLPKADGTCPSCQAVIVKGEKGKNKEEEHVNEKPQQRGGSRQSSKGPSYGLGAAIIIIAVVIEVIGRLIVGAINETSRGRNLRDVIVIQNGAMAIRGTVDVIMLVLIVIGIILLVRTFLERKKASKS